MGRETAHIDDLCCHVDGLAHDLNLFGSFDQVPSHGAFRLIPGKDHGALRTPQVVLQVMEDPPRIGHTAGRHNDLGTFYAVDHAGLFRCCGKMRIFHGKEPVTLEFNQRPCLRVVFLLVGQGDSRCLGGQGAVDVNRYVRDLAFLGQLLEIIQQHLSTPYRKGRKDHVPAPFYRFIDDLRQFRFLIINLVLAVAIGRLRGDEVRPLQDGGVFNDGLVGLAHVAGKDHGGLFAILLNFQPDHRTAQDMTCNPELRRYPGNDLKRFFKIMNIKIMQRRVGIVHREQRKHPGFPGPQSFPVGIFRIRLLDMGAVRQKDRTQLLGRFRAVNASLEAFLHQPGDQAAVVHMGMGQHHGIDFRRIKGKRSFIKILNGFGTLEHTAVNQHFLIADLQQITGTRHRPGRT